MVWIVCEWASFSKQKEIKFICSDLFLQIPCKFPVIRISAIFYHTLLRVSGGSLPFNFPPSIIYLLLLFIYYYYLLLLFPAYPTTFIIIIIIINLLLLFIIIISRLSYDVWFVKWISLFFCSKPRRLLIVLTFPCCLVTSPA